MYIKTPAAHRYVDSMRRYNSTERPEFHNFVSVAET